MSPLLYSLGRLCFRRRARVVAAWAILVVVAGALALALQRGPSNNFTIPGTESAAALDTLGQTFPQVAGAPGQVLVVAHGVAIDDPAIVAQIQATARRLAAVPGVAQVQTPWTLSVANPALKDPVRGGYVPLVNPSHSAALLNLQMGVNLYKVTPAMKNDLVGVAKWADTPELTYYAGGPMFLPATPGIEPTELLGMVIALGVMGLTFGSLRAAGLPLAIALTGVAISISITYLATRWMTVAATAPLVAVMIGLALGIDYSLFILSRHRAQLAEGIDVEESAGRAIATSGSAVFFAGLTVMIALLGLAVARIPFLTVMGLAAAVGVLLAVSVVLTLLPAIMGLMGPLLVPGARVRRVRDADGEITRTTEIVPPRAKRQGALAGAWVKASTRAPAATIAVVVAVGVAVASLAIGLRLALPDNSTAPKGSPQRIADDMITKEFGPGFNGPLLVTANIIQSTDPLGLVSKVAAQLRQVPGVVTVPLATPNPDADTMVAEVIPSGAPSDQSTNQLVDRIRAMRPQFQSQDGVRIAVTGQTAIELDISSQLGRALLPFGILVVGMSLIILAAVFRSVFVPIKATLGYLLSVGVAFGITTEIYQRGFLKGPLTTADVGPVISFAPIMLMGTLFGLAMDYEVFLVSRMREEFVHSGKVQRSIRQGFVASSRVVTAAAVIMCSVFFFFVPNGDPNIQPIAMSLTVGVFFDAFVVRMTLVPAMMAVAGERAWWIPKWLDRALPVLDVEGEGVHRQIELQNWPRPDAPPGVYLDGMSLVDLDERLYEAVDVAVEPGEILLVEGGPTETRTALLLTIAGRMRPTAGRVKVAGLVLPEQAVVARSYLALVRGAEEDDVAAAVRRELRHRTRVLVVDGLDLVPSEASRQEVLDEICRLCKERPMAAVVSVTSEAADLLIIPEGVQSLDMSIPGFPAYLDREPGLQPNK